MTVRANNHVGYSLNAFTLVEVVMSLAIAAIVIGGIVYGYVLTATRAEWSAHSIAAQALANQTAEQTRAARWEPNAGVDQLVPSYFPAAIEILDVPLSAANRIYATNFTQITTVSSDPPLKLIQVDCVWSLRGRGPFSNTVVTYRAPSG